MPPLLTLTVKQQATGLQMAPAYDDVLRARPTAFLQEAQNGAAPPPVHSLHVLRAALARLWSPVWPPRHKAPLWRLDGNQWGGGPTWE